YALDYLNIYVLGTIFVELSAGLVYFITAQGCSTVSMISVGIGAVLNIILDPIFIFVFKWGVRGAAIATVISQCVSMIFVLSFLLGKKALLRLRLSSMRIDFRLLGSCLALGVSPWVMYATECLVSISFNRSLLLYGGNIAVGAMTIFTTVMQTAILPLSGFAQGAQPIISFNYGAGRLDRVWDACKLLLKVSLAFSTLFWLLVLITPQLFIRLFTVDEALIAFASKMMYIFFGSLFAMGAQIACQNMFLALGNAKISLFLALLRKIILLIPLIFILPLFLPDKTVAVFLAEPISDIIAAATTTTLFLRQFIKKKL
ncbi:MAG: polysaccharide biosynthesis C-terminal domain-containing protein, partial [Oscillospiraceae bacterium]|nr:polysaccharide biosynthesis C-terminal domain-containing protein [Oscillospiraceae bacterium]